jgi:lipopolysaccharide/colanic/teichoic acid biosynthesis glycosyltransferase
VVIWKQMGRPIIFTQERAGLHGKPFRIFKFRTMTNDRDAEGRLLPDYERITPLGRFLRSTSLDELPQLWNVLRGEMSLIGPRPLLVRYLDRYTPEQNRRHEVMPGLAGLPALFGRSEQNWEESLARDVWYVDHLSFWLDLKLIVGILIVVIKREGVARSADGRVPEFMGTAAAPVAEPAPPAPALDTSRLSERDPTVAV